MKIITGSLLFFGLFFSQFYIFGSGTPQPSHIMLLGFSCLFFIDYLYGNRVGGVKLYFGNDIKLLVFFVFYCAFVNLIFSIVEQDAIFQISTVYIIYNTIIFFSIIYYLQQNPESKRLIFLSLAISLLLLFALSIFGIGRFNFSPRYNGFFNDPNQMAFWAICCFVSVNFVVKLNKYLMLILFAMLTAVIIYSMSRSGLVALLLISLGVFLSYYTKNQLIIIVYLAFVTIVVLLLSDSHLPVFNMKGEEDVFTRLVNTDFREQAQIRGYGRFFDFSEYLIFGAGQGLDNRFNSRFEIHSTWAGVFFYYGVIGLSALIYFLFSIARNLDLPKFLIFLAPLFYSFSTYGLRTPIFWVMLAIVYFISVVNKQEFQ